MSDRLYGFISLTTGVVELVSRFDDPHEGFDVATLPDGVWIGWVRRPDGTFGQPSYGDDEPVSAEVPA